MNAQPAIIQVPLSQLRLSPRNARKTGGHDIEGLAASIAAHNLLQNLTVTSGANDDEYEVVAGGRRLAAMQLLRDRGALDAEFSVPCKLIADDDVALEASTAENTLREAMHPADQFDAFRGMVEAKKPIEDIAAHFGVSELVVKQRLKLAKVSPKLVQVYRDGGMELDQLQALALTDDQKQQESVWYGAKHDYNRTARDIRQAVTGKEVRSDSAIAQFVGLSAYEAAGGAVRRDLWSSRDEAFLGDRALLDKLALDKLQKVADSEVAAGWSWAEARISMDYEVLATYPHAGVEPKHQKPTAEDKARIAEIEQRRQAITSEMEAINQSDDPDYDASDLLNEEDDALLEENTRLARGREIWPADVLTKAGSLVYLSHHGIAVERGRLKPGQKATASGDIIGKAKGATADKPKKAALSQDMIQRLEMHRAAAIREHVAADPAGALQLLLTHLLTGLLTSSHAGSVLDLPATNAHAGARGLIESKFADVGKAPARRAIDDRVAAWMKAGMPGKGSELHAWIGGLTDAKRAELLALAVALTVNTNAGQRGQALAEQFAVDMTAWWTPTPDTFIGVVQKALLAEAVADVAGKSEGDAILALKKAAAMAETAKNLAGTGWLPKPLRGSRYRLKSAAVAKSPAKKVAGAAAGKAKKTVAAKKVSKGPAKKAARAK